ncbi:MAG TPA: GNAT family N-acetyltransferase [Noviherbaspirillum sp.]|nr:GNAT family N-acetyltransferase [Noviherbaspirillum sp.]
MAEIRGMAEADVASVMRVQSECYAPSMVEAEATLRLRLREFPETAWVAADGQGVCGYLVAYGSRLGKVTPLGAPFGRYDAPDALYLHDLAVSARAKGQGVAKQLVRAALEHAVLRGFLFSALVSVQGSQAFWRALGYVPWDSLRPDQRSNLLTYESRACYMVNRLVPAPGGISRAGPEAASPPRRARVVRPARAAQ